jgi:hypothetical protein
MGFREGTTMVFGKESRVALAVLAAAVLVLAGVFASPARAQVDEEVLDVLVDVEVGECDEGQCDEGERPVTFTPVLSLNADLEQELLDAGVAPADVDAALDAALDAAAEVVDFGEIVVEDSEGNEVARVDPGETVCLEPGSYTASASVDNAEVTAQAAIDELEALLTDVDLSQLVENVDVVDEVFVVDECDEVPDDGDDRDQTVCQIVVTEVNDLQNPDVDVNNAQDEEAQALQEPEEGEVSEEQVVDIAEELNVSERIVRRCIQNNIGEDVTIGDDDNNDGNNDDGTDTADDTTARDDLKDDVIVDTIPDKTLPDTGGVPLPALAALALAFVVAGALVLRGVMRRHY